MKMRPRCANFVHRGRISFKIKVHRLAICLISWYNQNKNRGENIVIQEDYSAKIDRRCLPADRHGIAACALSSLTLIPCCLGVLILYILLGATASTERTGVLLAVISLLSGVGLMILFYIFIPAAAVVVALSVFGIAKRRQRRSCIFSISGLIFVAFYVAAFIVMQTMVI